MIYIVFQQLNLVHWYTWIMIQMLLIWEMLQYSMYVTRSYTTTWYKHEKSIDVYNWIKVQAKYQTHYLYTFIYSIIKQFTTHTFTILTKYTASKFCPNTNFNKQEIINHAACNKILTQIQRFIIEYMLKYLFFWTLLIHTFNSIYNLIN